MLLNLFSPEFDKKQGKFPTIFLIFQGYDPKCNKPQAQILKDSIIAPLCEKVFSETCDIFFDYTKKNTDPRVSNQTDH